MKKPPPPDDSRIEIVLADDKPETHQTAIETARILSAGKLIPHIQKHIDECRAKIQKVSKIMVMCSYYIAEAEETIRGGGNFDAEYFDRKCIDVKEHELFEICLPEDVPVLTSTVAQIKFNTTLTYRDKYKKDKQPLLRVLAQCHEKIAQLLARYIPKFQAELEKHEAQLEALMSLVTDK